MSMGSGSEITKLSSRSGSPYPELKIPRVHPPLEQHHSSSGSDGPIISDTLPSDYPSESQSEIEEVDTRSLPVSSIGSYENHGYLQESVYSENLGHIQEIHAMAVKAPSPQFDVQVRVKRAPPPPPSPPSTCSESSASESIAASRNERNNLSTIIETHEDRESILTVDSLPHVVSHTQFEYTPEIHPAPKYIPPPTASSKLNKNLEEYVSLNTVSNSEFLLISNLNLQKKIWPEMPPQTRSEAHSMTEIVDTTHLYHTSVDIDAPDNIEPPIQISRKPLKISHVDDAFMSTITEKRTIEEIERERRMVSEYKTRVAPPPDPKWDVRIRNYEQAGPQWEDFSDISSASGMTAPRVEKPLMAVPPMAYISETGEHLRSPEMVGNMKPIELPEEDKSVPNWDVLIRVLEDFDETHDNRYETSTNILKRNLSYEDRIKWKEIITTESTLRKMLTEAVVREDFERISRDVRYEGLFEPQSWDIIIRILAPPDDIELRAPRKSKDKRPAWDTRSRRSSLPTLYEYDSDGGSSVRTIRGEALIVSTQQPGPSYQYIPRSRKTSRSSYKSDNVDMRSMTEVTVDFARQESIDNRSDVSSYQPR
jgi:hypothetical protein